MDSHEEGMDDLTVERDRLAALVAVQPVVLRVLRSVTDRLMKIEEAECHDNDFCRLFPLQVLESVSNAAGSVSKSSFRGEELRDDQRFLQFAELGLPLLIEVVIALEKGTSIDRVYTCCTEYTNEYECRLRSRDVAFRGRVSVFV